MPCNTDRGTRQMIDQRDEPYNPCAVEELPNSVDLRNYGCDYCFDSDYACVCGVKGAISNTQEDNLWGYRRADAVSVVGIECIDKISLGNYLENCWENETDDRFMSEDVI